ncbi:MAG: sugar ABC transporter ATP-binding protein, partial [Sulfolobales archaeon]
ENADIICLDEPTSPLTSMEAKVLFEVMEELRKKGKSMVFITHRVEEVFQIANRVTVLRDGVKVFTEDVSKTSPYEVIKHMLGKELEEFYPPRVEAKSLSRTSPRLRVVSLTTASDGKGVKLEGVSFDVYPGEILGVVGLLGSGKTELGKALVGAQRVVSGEIYVNGVKATIKSPVDALKLGIFYIPEDRRREGLVTQLTISDNIVLPKVFKTSSMSLIRQAQVERGIAGRWIKSLRIVPSDPSFKVANLSGGNQQKVVIAKSLETGAKILILDEPTFGIDIGTKVEIRKLIRSLASEGYSIVLLTSDVDEALALSDRILVIASGKVTNVMENRNLSREILISMLGGQVG